MRTLVTGATGYIGGRLVPELLRAGYAVRVLARHPERLADRTWVDDVEVVAGDATDPAAVREAMRGIDVAYYLMHSLMQGAEFEHTELEIARLFGETARSEQVGRMVYLGGLQPADAPPDLSDHMRSRGEVGRILRSSGVPTAELRAAVIIGSGSASFEIIRYLTERLPVMVTPRWLRTRTQPIAIRDVLYYLVSAATLPAEVNRTFDIGGPDITTYEGMIEGYAAVAGLRKRLIIQAPVLTPRLSSRWVGLVTPVPSVMARPLVESLTVESVCLEHDIAQHVPDPEDGLIPYRTAVDLALQRVQHAEVRTTWSSSSTPGAPSDPMPADPAWAGGLLYTDERETVVDASPGDVWAVIEGMGGERGYYSFPLAWEVRGWLDRASGGVGLARGRRDPDTLRTGDVMDFWRVEERRPLELLRLRGEFRMPGLAWLELGIRTEDDARGRPVTVYTQRALFHPRGYPGEAYWAAMKPFHGVIFGSMLKNIRVNAEAVARKDAVPLRPSG